MSTDLPLVRVRRFDHIALRRPDPERTAAWYAAVLGLEPRFVAAFGESSPVTVGAGDCSLSIFPGDSATFEHVAFELTVDELVAGGEQLVRRGVDHHLSDHGIARSLYLTDPDGQTVELTAYTTQGARP